MSASRPIFSIRRLRWAIVVAGILLMAVLAGYIGYARYRMHKLVADLPGRLGINITQETDHVTYSQTWQGRTVFTLRAAKQVQHKDGKITLQDVGIILYGRKGDRQDRIHGNQFEYDQKNGIMSAVGEVFIDLAPPQKAGDAGRGEDETKLIHLKTSGLIFHQKDQFAETDEPLEFALSGMTGTAVGASYDSNKGVVVLQSQVHVSGLRGKLTDGSGGERPMVLTARHAELDRLGNVAVLEDARMNAAGASGSQEAQAQYAVVHMSEDGTPERVDASGKVALTGEGRGRVTSDRLELELNDAGQPKAAHLSGSVQFFNEADDKAESGRANEARVAFDAQGRPVHATMIGAVEAALLQGASSRSLKADKAELELGGGGKAPVVLRGAVATAADGARLRMVDASSRKDAKGKVTNGTLTTNLRADVLTARFAAKALKSQVTGVDGAGRTVVERTLVDAGAATPAWHEVGSGDSLKVDFRQGAKDRAEMTRAEQRGGVQLVREAAAKKGAAADVEHADGDVAVYDADADRVTMSGGVKISDAESALFADRVEMNRATGDGVAEGSVRVSYLQQGSTGEPVHVIAARAIAHKATGLTQFFAAAGGNARMWQGGSTVEAPVLEFDRTKRVVTAHGTGSGQAVKTVLVEEPKPGAKPSRKSGVPVRILSREMVYTDATREVKFTGSVQVNDQDGEMRSQVATVYLAGKTAAGDIHPTSRGEPARDGAPGELGLGGRVDRMVASGAVELEEPGRKGSGDKLVYTAEDKTFVLTGTKAAPPKIVDAAQGTVTGASLRFRSGNDSVEVLSGYGAERVRTETRMKPKD